MKAVVIGYGITGCISALYLCRRGYQVSIYDSSPAKGGNMHDIICNQSRYFNNRQYLNSHVTWFEDLRHELTCDFLEFEHTCSSYTSILDEVIVQHDFPGPVIKRPMQGLNSAETNSESLLSRLSIYPQPVSSGLLNWAQLFAADLDRIHYKCAEGIQLSRVYFDYDDHDLIKHKQESPLADDLLGVPGSIIDPNSSRIKACIPVNGFDGFFRKLHDFLKLNGIQIFPDSPVIPRRQPGGDISIFCREHKINADLIIWAGNPVPVIHAAGFGKLDNPVCKMILYVCYIDNQSSSLSPHYIQVFSNNSNITRIYLYEIDGVKKATVECFDKNELIMQSVIADANIILAESGFKFKLLMAGSIRQKRYIFYTIDDYRRFETFEEFSAKTNMIGGAWWAYGHNAKIDIIFDQIAARNCL